MHAVLRYFSALGCLLLATPALADCANVGVSTTIKSYCAENACSPFRIAGINYLIPDQLIRFRPPIGQVETQAVVIRAFIRNGRLDPLGSSEGLQGPDPLADRAQIVITSVVNGTLRSHVLYWRKNFEVMDGLQAPGWDHHIQFSVGPNAYDVFYNDANERVFDLVKCDVVTTWRAAYCHSYLLMNGGQMNVKFSREQLSQWASLKCSIEASINFLSEQ